MLEASMTLEQFKDAFPTEAACVEHLYRLRWPHGFICPSCGSTKGYPVRRFAGMFECPSMHQISVKSGTSFHGSKQTLSTWFYAIWLVTSGTAPSIPKLAKALGMRVGDKVYWIHRKIVEGGSTFDGVLHAFATRRVDPTNRRDRVRMSPHEIGVVGAAARWHGKEKRECP